MSASNKTHGVHMPSKAPPSLSPSAEFVSASEQRRQDQENVHEYTFDLCPMLLSITSIEEVFNIRAFKVDRPHDGAHNVGVTSFVMQVAFRPINESSELALLADEWMRQWRKKLKPEAHYQVDFFEELLDIDGDLPKSLINNHNIVMIILVAIVLELHHHGKKISSLKEIETANDFLGFCSVEHNYAREEPYEALHKLFQHYEKLFIKPLTNSSQKTYEELDQKQKEGVYLALKRDDARCMVSKQYQKGTEEQKDLVKNKYKSEARHRHPGADLRFICFCHENMTNAETFRVAQFTLHKDLIPTTTPEALKDLIYTEDNIMIVDEKFVRLFNEHKISLGREITEAGKFRRCPILTSPDERIRQLVGGEVVEFEVIDPRDPPSEPPSQKLHNQKPPSLQSHHTMYYESPSSALITCHRAIFHLCQTGIMSRSRQPPLHVMPAQTFGDHNFHGNLAARPQSSHSLPAGEHEPQSRNIPSSSHAPGLLSSPMSGTEDSRRPQTAGSTSTGPLQSSPMTEYTPPSENKRSGSGR